MLWIRAHLLSRSGNVLTSHVLLAILRDSCRRAAHFQVRGSGDTLSLTFSLNGWLSEMRQYMLADPSMIRARMFDDEIVAAHFATGVYYSFRGAAAEVWCGLMAGIPIDHIAQIVAVHSSLSSEDFTQATYDFVAALEREQLIKPAAVKKDHWEPKIPPIPFGLPAYERYTDMEELLLLDPVHDVDGTGWPDSSRTKVD